MRLKGLWSRMFGRKKEKVEELVSETTAPAFELFTDNANGNGNGKSNGNGNGKSNGKSNGNGNGKSNGKSNGTGRTLFNSLNLGLKNLIQQKYGTLKNFAVEVDMSYCSVRYVLSGRCELGIVQVKRWSKALGLHESVIEKCLCRKADTKYLIQKPEQVREKIIEIYGTQKNFASLVGSSSFKVSTCLNGHGTLKPEEMTAWGQTLGLYMRKFCVRKEVRI